MGKTLAQKIFDAHTVDTPAPGVRVLSLDRVFCHEITTPIAINDLVAIGKDRVFDPTKIKAVIDHVTPAKDSKTAEQGKTMREWAKRQGIKDFFDIGENGVCHAIFPEKGFVRPGFTVIMGDSHTCTHGAFGAFAAGVGTTDLEVGILKGVCTMREPATIKVVLNGKLRSGVFAKDVILAVIRLLTVNGATDKVIEFTGPAVDAMGMDSRMTLCNMAIEAGGHLRRLLPRHGHGRFSLAVHQGRLCEQRSGVGRVFEMAAGMPTPSTTRSSPWTFRSSSRWSLSATSPTRSRPSARWRELRSIRSISAAARTAVSRTCALRPES